MPTDDFAKIVEAFITPQVRRIDDFHDRLIKVESRLSVVEDVDRKVDAVLQMLQTIVKIRNFVVWILPLLTTIAIIYGFQNR